MRTMIDKENIPTEITVLIKIKGRSFVAWSSASGNDVTEFSFPGLSKITGKK